MDNRFWTGKRLQKFFAFHMCVRYYSNKKSFTMVTGWELDNKNYVVINGKIAAKVTDTVSTLFSQGPQFDENHIIEFKVVTCNTILFTFFSS